MSKLKRIPCDVCGTSDYNELYDAYYCIKCDKWLEPKCNDVDCSICLKRPSKPSEMNENKDK
jgi:hypothetical protein